MYNSLIKKVKNSLPNKTVKLIITLLMAFCFLPACSFSGMRVDIIEEETENENEIIYLEIPQIKAGDNEFYQNLNEDYKSSINKISEDFKAKVQNIEGERDTKAKLTVNQDIKYNKNNLLSIVGEVFEYTSGTTGTLSRMCLNIDTKNQQKLYLRDLFNDDEYIQFLNSRLEKLSAQDMYSDIWEQPKIGEDEQENFYFSEEGLVIFYPPYELSYYARGFVEFTIPYSELYGYLKTEYNSLY